MGSSFAEQVAAKVTAASGDMFVNAIQRSRNQKDIVMVPAFPEAQSVSNTAQRAEEERRTIATKRRTNEWLRRIKRTMLIKKSRRRQAGRGKRPRKPTQPKSPGKSAPPKGGIAKIGSRVVPIVSQMALIADMLVVGTQVGRRVFDGKSFRLVRKEDAEAMGGQMHEQLIASATALGYAESDKDFLRQAAQDERMSKSLNAQVRAIKTQALRRAQGADKMELDPTFDSADFIGDKWIKKINEEGIGEIFSDIAQTIRRGF